jgi:hypothetical protein
MSLNPLSSRRSPGWNLVSLLALGALASPFACSSNDTVDGTVGNTAAVTNGTGYDPVCKGGTRDGFCDAFGQPPESCMCLDCAQTAYCKKACKDDGTCDTNAGEDCTCMDCLGKSIDNQDCQLSMGNGNGNGPGPTSAATTGTAGGGGGAGTTTASSTSAATTTAASTTGGAGGATTATTAAGG